jgi:hypothetical protein
VSTISKFLALPPNAFSTQIASATVAADALSVNLDATTDLPTEGVGQFFKKDANGEVVAGSVEFVHWTNVSGNTITFSDTDDRGIPGSDSGAQAYVADDYFEVWASSYYTSYGGLVEHLGDGTHDSTKVVVLSSGDITSTLTGWMTAGETWTYASADAPTFTFTVSGDKTTKYSVGMRIKLTQTTDKYFIITKVEYSDPNTTVTVYGGTDYPLVDATITNPFYSVMKAPYGFPLSPSKWTVETVSTTNRTTSTPTANAWYNAESINVPIGIWSVNYQATLRYSRNSTALSERSTLSTANNSESDSNWTASFFIQLATGDTVRIENVNKNGVLSLTTKATYYLNYSTTQSSMSDIAVRGDNNPTIIRAVSAYL